MNTPQLAIPKVWRSELARLLLFFILCILSVILSRKLPGSIISGKLFGLGSREVILHLPLFWLIPLVSLLDLIGRIRNVEYHIDNQGIIAKEGIISFKQSITRIRFEDIRSLETEQSVIGRMLNVGNIEIGTAAISGVEVVLKGIGAPNDVREFIQMEREKRIKLAAKRGLRLQETEKAFKGLKVGKV